MENRDETRIHLMPRQALREVMRMCIENKDNDTFIEAVREHDGFEIVSMAPLFKFIEFLVVDNANGRLFETDCPDKVEVTRVYEVQGFRAAKNWLYERFRFHVTGRRRKNFVTRVVYLPPGSKLEAAYTKQLPKVAKLMKDKETFKLVEK
jgi:hypothetical protein